MSWQWHVMPGTCPHHDSNVFCAWCHGYDSDMSWLCQNRNTCHYHDISSPQYAMIYHYHDSNISWSYHCRDMLWRWQCHRNRCHSNHRDMSWQCHNSNTCNYHDMSLPWHAITIKFPHHSPQYHGMLLPWQAITITCHYHDMSLPWEVIIMRCQYHDKALPWHFIIVIFFAVTYYYHDMSFL